MYKPEQELRYRLLVDPTAKVHWYREGIEGWKEILRRSW